MSIDKFHVLWLTFAIACASTTPTPLQPTQVHLRGTAYSFINQQRLAGATIQVAELSTLATLTSADGAYDLSVDVTEGGADVTPYVVMEGYHTIYLQTFHLKPGQAGMEHVNFQTPDEGIFGALATIVGIDPKTQECQLVTTINEKAVANLNFADFVAHGAHGVAGATVTATPALPKPIFFNEKVIPDASRTESSRDGGVLWTNVPEGVYEVRAVHPTQKFDTFTATCRKGRIVNANPPWGLREM